jgi:hypothetical protein
MILFLTARHSNTYWDINAIVFEGFPSGKCKYYGHSLANGMYLMNMQ